MELNREECKKDILDVYRELFEKTQNLLEGICVNNRGQITVFLSLIMTVMLLIGLTALEVVRLNMGKAVFSYGANGAIEDLKAGYVTELFENYHLLFLDGKFGGQGEAAMEQQVIEYMEYTLSQGGYSDIGIEEVVLTGTVGALEEKCKPLKNEIIEYMKLYSEVSAVENLIDVVTNGDDASEDAQYAVKTGKTEENDSKSDWEGDDPRDILKESTRNGLLTLVTPDGTAPSKNEFDMENYPSKKQGISEEEDTEINFENIDLLESQLGTSDYDCILPLQENYYGIAYGLECFDYYTCEKDYNNPMECEVEYLICGKNSDYKNLSSVVNKIVLHRLPFNFIYLITDKSRLAKIETIAIALSLIPGISYAAVKYLLIGCWSYAETIVEIKSLLAGNKIPYIKTSETWLTDIENLGNIGNIESLDYEGAAGIDYKGFLMILMAEHIDRLYYRMADVIQLNMRQFDENFLMENMLYAWTLQISGSGSKKYMPFIKSQDNVDAIDDNVYQYNISMQAGY